MTQPAFSDDTPSDEPVVYRHVSTTMIVILVLGLFAILLVWSLRPAKPLYFGQGVTHPAVGRGMQDFQLAPLGDATEPTSVERLRGSVVLLNFWGTWCPPCMSEFPHLVDINDRLKSEQRFRFVPISCGPGGAEVPIEQLQQVTAAYLAKLNTELDVYHDPGGAVRHTVMNSAALPDFSFPTTVLLDQQGKIAALWQGYAPGFEREMETAIKTLLKS